MDTKNLEILQVADAVAREKSIDREHVIQAIELAIQKAGRTKYGHEHDIRATIDRKTGHISLARYRQVVEELEDEVNQLTVAEAKKIDPALKLGDFIIDPLPPIDFGRVAAQTARQVIMQKVKEAERERQYEEFKDKVGEIVSGVIKRVEFGNVYMDIGRAEGILRRDEIIPRENFKPGDRVRVYVADVRSEPHGPQIFLSRTHPQFLVKLFEQEVPEIYDNIIQIKAVARDPGSRAKIAVYSEDRSIDPVGSCVGMRGSRVQAVVNELQGEKIDIFPYSENVATLVVSALSPAEVKRVVVEEEQNKLIVVVPDDQLSQAIGRRGQNVRLASQLIGWALDVMTETNEAKYRAESTTAKCNLFMKALDVDDVLARLLVAEGFSNLEEIAYIELDELVEIEGFDAELAEELQNRAKDYLAENQKISQEEANELGVTKELSELQGLTPEMLLALGKNNIKTLDDFAELASDEVIEMLPEFKITEDEANEMVMAARSHWFDDEVKAPIEESLEIDEQED